MRDEYEEAARQALEEAGNARFTFGPFNSPHEGYAVLLEEVHELWAEVMASKHGGNEASKRKMNREAMQVAAMAICFMVEST